MAEIRWQKSSFSGSNEGGSCVELATGATGLRHLRESDDPGVVLAVDAENLRSFLLAVKEGEFDHLA
ncbi:DUF397 domain-containing protein [Kitasatospora purpeofusca]|uniref:DUF397 domain-containing protein n=1 Tax=Kitasatospora purpeofusca TaxID=67352 RepID=UPI00225ABA93|nr:DUF397 domain-containing protein [Kitasatospora purpeofusca]MCX4685930.1 DUF397 domain-containing protein [Kitasatospora purpeofusca]MCX4753188.1 DUF397 domain-containing protein [Kitasatospora purpeofusca]WSR32711.1 DUF397 domain-containing protein [Kitasatospora purpeofusca]WSR40803.1 DUF397 domain-containing protein [Kitasatospora purpeofusca]